MPRSSVDLPGPEPSDEAGGGSGLDFEVQPVHDLAIVVGHRQVFQADRRTGPALRIPYTDHAPTGPDDVFPEPDVDNIVAILNTVKSNAAPADGVA